MIAFEFLFAMLVIWFGGLLLIYFCVFVHYASRRYLNMYHKDTFDFWVKAGVAVAVLVYALFFAGPLPSHRMDLL